VVPIVPAAVVFDLPVGGWKCGRRPSSATQPPRVPVRRLPSARGCGDGRACRVLQGRCGDRIGNARFWRHVGAIVIVNAAGDVNRHRHRAAVAGDQTRSSSVQRLPSRSPPIRRGTPSFSPLNTTIAVVATDAALSPAGCRRVAVAAHAAWPAPSARATHRWTAIRCSRWPPAPSRCAGSKTPRRCRRRRADHRGRRAAADWLGPCGAGRRVGGRSVAGIRRTGTCCRERPMTANE